MSARGGQEPPRRSDRAEPAPDRADERAPRTGTGAGAPARNGRSRTVLWIAAGILAAFLAGFVWQYMEAREARDARDLAERELVYQRLGNVLGSAVVQAGQGNHEPARQLASRFYSELDEHLRAAPDAPGAVEPGTLEQVLRGRDDMITALSRGNPDSEDLLAGTFVRFHRAAGFVDPGPELPGAADPEPPGGAGAPGEDEDGVP